jgi:hypothetical protein
VEALLETLMGIFGGGFLGFLVATGMGQLVPGSRVAERDATIARLEAAAEKREEAYDTLKQIVDRQAMVADVTRAVLEATHATAIGQATPGHAAQAGTTPGHTGVVAS